MNKFDFGKGAAMLRLLWLIFIEDTLSTKGKIDYFYYYFIEFMIEMIFEIIIIGKLIN